MKLESNPFAWVYFAFYVLCPVLQYVIRFIFFLQAYIAFVLGTGKVVDKEQKIAYDVAVRLQFMFAIFSMTLK